MSHAGSDMDYGPANRRSITPSALNAIPTFNPKESNARWWLDHFETHAQMFSWDDNTKLQVARWRMGQDAAPWLSRVLQETHTWQDFCDAMIERFAPREDELHKQLANCRQRLNETVREYADRFVQLLSNLDIPLDHDATQKHNFLRGLNKDVHRQVLIMRPRTLKEAIRDSIYVSEAFDGPDEKDTDTWDREPKEKRVRFDTRWPEDETRNDRLPSRGGYGNNSGGRGGRDYMDRPNGSRYQPPPVRRDDRSMERITRQEPNMEAKLDELNRKFSRMALNMQQMQRGERIETNMFEVDEITDDSDTEGAHELYAQHAYETYTTKRVRDFEPIRIPIKRTPIDVRTQEDTRTQADRPQPMDTDEEPVRTYQRPGLRDEETRIRRTQRQPPAPAAAPDIGRTVRGPGGAATRTDPVRPERPDINADEHKVEIGRAHV